jgi:hypothetical protein
LPDVGDVYLPITLEPQDFSRDASDIVQDIANILNDAGDMLTEAAPSSPPNPRLTNPAPVIKLPLPQVIAEDFMTTAVLQQLPANSCGISAINAISAGWPCLFSPAGRFLPGQQ